MPRTDLNDDFSLKSPEVVLRERRFFKMPVVVSDQEEEVYSSLSPNIVWPFAVINYLVIQSAFDTISRTALQVSLPSLRLSYALPKDICICDLLCGLWTSLLFSHASLSLRRSKAWRKTHKQLVARRRASSLSVRDHRSSGKSLVSSSASCGV